MNSFTWGLLLLLVGFSIIFKAIFGISIPILRLIFGTFLICAGIKCITNRYSSHASHHTSSWSYTWNSKKTVMFSNGNMSGMLRPESEYNTVFGQSTIDLSTIEFPSYPTYVKINTVFSNSTLIINPAIPTVVKLNTTLGHANIPHESFYWIGNSSYSTTRDGQSPLLIIEANVVFSNFVIKNI